MSPFPTASCATGGPGEGCKVAGALQSGLAEVLTSLEVWHRRQVRRRAAVTIDDRTLADIGLIRAQIDHEAGKPFWRA